MPRSGRSALSWSCWFEPILHTRFRSCGSCSANSQKIVLLPLLLVEYGTNAVRGLVLNRAEAVDLRSPGWHSSEPHLLHFLLSLLQYLLKCHLLLLVKFQVLG